MLNRKMKYFEKARVA